MKNIIIGLLLVLSAALTGCLGPDETKLFAQGNGLLAQDRCGEAISAYRKLEKAGIREPELYCNLGNAWLKAGRAGWATFYYEQALALAPTDQQIRSNLNTALQQLGTAPVPLATPFTLEAARVTWCDWLMKASLLGLLLSAVLSILVAAASDRPELAKIKRFSRYTMLAAGSLWVLTSGTAAALEKRYAIVVRESSGVRSGPSHLATKVFAVKEGDKLKVATSFKGWLKVENPQGQQGWLAKDSVACLL